jgi:hypothetical protein
MSATLTVAGPYIESIQKKHVDMPKGRRTPLRNPNNERNALLSGRNLQGAILDAFDKHGTQSERDKVWTMRGCVAQQLWQECPNGHEGRLHQTEFCGQRLCPTCQKRRAILAKKKYRPALSQALAGAYTDGQRLVALFVTLTWPSIGTDQLVKKTTRLKRGADKGMKEIRRVKAGEDMVSRMWGDLAKLKRQAWWSNTVVGETWSFEWTFSPAFGHHPHAHGIIMVPAERYEACQAEFKAAGVSGRAESARWWADNGPIPKPTLSAAWEKLTKAKVVHVQLIRPRRKEWGNQEALNAALDECLKYPMKETDYLYDRELRADELAEIDRRQGEIYDREKALVELYRAIRGRRLTDVRGVIRGHLKEALREVEEATTEQLLHMDIDDMLAVATRCSCCAADYVEREYVQRGGRYDLVAEKPLGTAYEGYDSEARKVIDMDRQRQTARHVAKSAGRAWTRFLNERRKNA